MFLRRTAFFLLPALVFSGCASVVDRDISDITPQGKPMTQEQIVGEQIHQQILASFYPYTDPKVVRYVNDTGRKLAARARRRDLEYRFTILYNEKIYATSAPGGYIYITTGMMNFLQSEAELAAVLAHEIGHIARKHVVKEIQKSGVWQAGTKLALSATDLSSDQEKVLQGLTDEAWKSLVVKGLSKEDEYEADRLAALNCSKIGYDPYGIYDFIKRLEPSENQPGPNLKTLLSTHPKPSSRLAELNKLYLKQGWEKGAQPDFPERYTKFVSENPVK